MNLSELFPARFIGSEDLQGKTPTLTMDKLVVEKVGHAGAEESKAVLYFREKRKATGEPIQLVLPKTNALAIAAMFGNEADEWTGHKITLTSEMVKFGRDTVPAIRIMGSPELTAPVKSKATTNIKARTLVPTGRTAAPAPDNVCEQRDSSICPECDADPCVDARGPYSQQVSA